MKGKPKAKDAEPPKLSREHERFKSEFLKRLQAKKPRPPGEPVFWDKYLLKWDGAKLRLAAEQPSDRESFKVEAVKWQAVVKSADEALLAHDPEYSGVQGKLNQATDAKDNIAVRQHFKKLALLDAGHRDQPNWMDEFSFTQAVRTACQDADGNFFISLGRILNKPSVSEYQSDNLHRLLLTYYVHGKPPDGVFLAVFSDSALVELAGIVIGRQCDEETLKKARQRLKLRKLGKPLIHQVKLKNGIILATA